MSTVTPIHPRPTTTSGDGLAPVRTVPLATPLWVVLGFTFLNSIGGGVVTTGFAFLSESAYGFTAATNYWLGLAQGAAYIVGALGVGPLLAGAMRRSERASPRLVVAGLMALLAALCAVPWAMHASGLPGSWPFWLLVTGYSGLTGVLWPVTESYLSGGRSGPRLRRATGAFNVVWSGALVVSFWAMASLIERRPLHVILAVSAIHVAAMGLLPLFTRKPAAHLPEDHVPSPEMYGRLLGVFRMQLPTSYLVYSALTPFLPLACQTLAIPVAWWTPLASVWLVTRVFTFWLLQCWHGWHGRWITAWIGSLLLLSGFGVAVLSSIAAGPWGLGRETGIAALIIGLGVFGVGMGVIYCSALYYAMAVGNAQVDAGGKHEALIGIGYGAGPICGLLAIAAADAGFLAADRPLGRLTGGHFQVLMLAVVAVAAAAIVAASLLRALRHATNREQESGDPGRNPHSVRG